MIVVDTSAPMAMLLHETEAAACKHCLAEAENVLLSAGMAAEALIVALGRGLRDEMTRTIEETKFEIVPVTSQITHRIGEIYAKWGKEIRPAGLNFGDCFAYELAQSRGCKLLYVSNDFSRTDVASALVV